MKDNNCKTRDIARLVKNKRSSCLECCYYRISNLLYPVCTHPNEELCKAKELNMHWEVS